MSGCAYIFVLYKIKAFIYNHCIHFVNTLWVSYMRAVGKWWTLNILSLVSLESLMKIKLCSYAYVIIKHLKCIQITLDESSVHPPHTTYLENELKLLTNWHVWFVCRSNTTFLFNYARKHNFSIILIMRFLLFNCRVQYLPPRETEKPAHIRF